MTTSTTKLIAALAISAGLLATNAAFAGHSGHSGGGNNGGGNSGNKTVSNFSAFKLNSTNAISNNHPNTISGISKKPITLSQSFKKVDSNKDHKDNNFGISLNSLKKDEHSKDMFCKKDNKCWFDWCCSKNCCYPYYFGCCYPSYCCYDYCTPTYECNYVSSPIVLSCLETTRVRVALGSLIMLNGQSFGGQPGGVRLLISGIAMPIQVVEWTPNGVKVQLPMFELTSVTPAEIEVVRPDGSVASKIAVELIAAPAPLAAAR
jgi:hypothetical protein